MESKDFTFETPLKEQFNFYIENAIKLVPDLNVDQLKRDIKSIEKDEYGPDYKNIRESDYIKQWYDSLEAGQPNYDLYSDYYYLITGWISWKKWSRNYIKGVYTKSDVFDNKLNHIIDFGSGLGLSTLALSKLCENMSSTNLDSLQLDFGKLVNPSVNFDNDSSNMGKCDVAFCSEYFEHFQHPLDHLDEIIKNNDPDVFIIANSFGVLHVGHFTEYFVGDKIIHEKKMSKLFNSYMKELGYTSQSYGLWNNRPQIWKKK